jgi:hypothetical protein
MLDAGLARRCLLTCAWLAFASAAQASEGERLGRGTQEWALVAGHGYGLDIAGAEGEDAGDVEFGALVPRWGLVLTPRLYEASWLSGNLEALVEGALLVAWEPSGGVAGGVSFGFRYNFLSFERMVPFVEIGVGLLGLDFDLESQADGLAFTPQAGAGLHLWLSSRAALTAQWRFHHISNADLYDDNVGINDSLFLVGATFFVE